MRAVRACRRRRPRPVPGSLRGWGGPAAAQDGGGQRSESPSRPSRSLPVPGSPAASPRSLRSPPLLLSPRSPSPRCSRSRTSPPPPNGRGRCCRAPRRVTRGSAEPSPARPLLPGAAAPAGPDLRSPFSRSPFSQSPFSRSPFPAVPR